MVKPLQKPSCNLIILASSSPRRKYLCQQLKLHFKVIPPRVDEDTLTQDLKLKPKELALWLAEKKALEVKTKIKASPNYWILAADTLIDFKGKIIGKPQNIREARLMLKEFAGKTHLIHTALVLIKGDKKLTSIATTKVRFRHLTSADIDCYLETKEWQGVAGGYRIQERGAFLIASLSGSYTNVVGLPVEDLYVMLKESGFLY